MVREHFDLLKSTEIVFACDRIIPALDQTSFGYQSVQKLLVFATHLIRKFAKLTAKYYKNSTI